MVKFTQPGGSQLPIGPGLRRGEKIKLLLMAALAVVLLGVFLFTLRSGERYSAEEEAALPAQVEAVPEERPFRPPVDRAALQGLVADDKGPDRAELEPEAAEMLMRAARQMTAAAFRDPEIGAVELDAATIPAVIADPAGARGEPFFARGWIETLETRRAGPASEERRLGRLQLEDGARVHFLIADAAETALQGDFVRINGLFLKVFTTQDPESGEWIEAPLLVGREPLRSSPAFETEAADREAIATVLADVTDDSIEGISGLPFDEQWRLMAIVRDLEPDAVDWSAAPVLDNRALQDLLSNGDELRGQPFRVPISVLMGITVLRAGENPARIDHYTDGWIGNTTWSAIPVVRFLAPAEYRDLRERDRIVAHGFFFKTYAFVPLQGGTSVAPVLVLSDLWRHHRPSDAPLRMAGYVVGASALLLLVLLTVLLRRDKKSSRELHDRLVQRRRARRDATTA